MVCPLSQVIDTVTINVIFWRWTATKEWSWIGLKIGREYLIKLVVAIALTPAVYAVHTFVVRVMRIEPEPHESATGGAD